MTERGQPPRALRIAVLGTGNLGGYLGIALSAAGARVCMLYKAGRVEGDSARMIVSRSGQKRLRGESAVLTDDPRCLDEADICLVCVKSRDTEAAGRLLAARRNPGWVLSLQNGIFNVDRLKKRIGWGVLGGLVTFNVTRDADGIRRQGTRGAVVVEDHPEAHPLLRRFAALLGTVGEVVELRHDIERAQADKLLLNLSNGVCAATGLSVTELLSDPDARACLRWCLREGERVLAAAGLKPARVGRLSAHGFARVLRLPGPILSLGAHVSGAVTDAARVSTLQDLERGRPTEIAELNGAIVTLAQRLGHAAPANEAVTGVVQAHERAALAGHGIVFPSPRELRSKIARKG